MFVGRKRELEKLEAMYSSGQFEFAVFYGRRRVGKTTLINEFCKNKKTIFFVASEAARQENLQLFSKAVSAPLLRHCPGKRPGCGRYVCG